MAEPVRSSFYQPAFGLALGRLLRKTEAAQIVELAVTLPLLVAIFVGIYDFGQAFNLKQKLSIAAREGARVAANQSTVDLTDSSGGCSAPASVCAVRDVVDAYLVANNVDDCGLGTTAAGASSGWSWTFNTTGCTGRVVTLIVNRGGTFTASGVTIEATNITLRYPYQWHFNRVVQFLVPGATFGGVTHIQTRAVMQNLN
jgi:Flp pilus assembly protein TadG